MTFRVLRFASWPALLGSCVLTACSSSTPQVPDAFVAATIQSAADRPGECLLTSQTTIVQIGTPTVGKPTVVTDGSQQNGQSNARVACKVAASGGGFDIELQATQEGPSGGTLTISSPPGAGAVTEQGAQNITGTWTSAQNGTFRETDCTIAYTYTGSPVPVNSGDPVVAPGRIWGHISCPHAINNDHTTMAPDGSSVSETCDNEADFVFENCSQ
jgi:hypothetical protein